MPCMCGDSECPSCGRAQGTYTGDAKTCVNCGVQEVSGLVIPCERHGAVDDLIEAVRLAYHCVRGAGAPAGDTLCFPCIARLKAALFKCGETL